VQQSVWGRLLDRLLRRPPTAASDPAAEAILRACEASYGRLRTYRDHGTCQSPNPVEGTDITFETRYRAPGAFFFHYRSIWLSPEKVAAGCPPWAARELTAEDGAFVDNDCAPNFAPEAWIWTLNAPAVRSWWNVQPNKPGQKTIEMAIGAHYGVSMTTSGMIASLLNPAFNQVTPVTALRAASILRLEDVEGDPCTVIGGIWASGLVKDRVELSISTATRLIRRIVTQPGRKDQITITYWPTVDEPLGDEAFAFTPPTSPR
jgi:hypothetical protein